MPPEGGGSGKESKANKGKGGVSDVAATGRRVIVFVLGGMSYSELRSIHEVSRATSRDIISGCTAMLTPQTFLLGLKQLKQVEPVALV